MQLQRSFVLVPAAAMKDATTGICIQCMILSYLYIKYTVYVKLRYCIISSQLSIYVDNLKCMIYDIYI